MPVALEIRLAFPLHKEMVAVLALAHRDTLLVEVAVRTPGVWLRLTM
jgi:hypothetical protein